MPQGIGQKQSQFPYLCNFLSIAEKEVLWGSRSELCSLLAIFHFPLGLYLWS